MKFYLEGLIRTAPNTGSPWFYILGIFYFILAIACFVDAYLNWSIYRTLKGKSEGAKFRVVILFFCGWLMIQRAIMTFVPTVMNIYVIFLFHQSVPLYLQYAIYSTFVLFLTKIVFYSKDNASKLNKLIQPIYGFSHLLLIVGVFIYPWYMTNHINENNFHVGNYGIAMVLYFLLSIFSIGFVLRVYWVIKNFHLNLNKKVKVKQTLFLISVISLLYFIQAIYGFFAIIGKNKIDKWANKKFLAKKSSYYAFIFFYLAITEISPCFIIWTVFHISLKRTRKVIYDSIPSTGIQSKNEDEFHFGSDSSFMDEFED
ncbi:tobamovirus multiplication protein 1-like isoform x1 [Anaeramoeba flamelloides]|nr:tobamovirus multiplication protein 1-like isoform x1 [Anaeramoeba flamelloides]